MTKGITPVKGMFDYYPDDLKKLHWLRDRWLNTGILFGFKEYDGPILEPIELYLEKSSEEIVREQSFAMTDRGGRNLIMRPELTPSLARMVAQRENQLNLPLRWQSFGRFFRYEKPQKGRSRAFYQWNIDIIGGDSALTDIEILQIAQRSLTSVGLDQADAVIRFNNRLLLQKALSDELNLPDTNLTALVRLIDRLDKISEDDFLKQVTALKLSTRQGNKLLDILKTPNFLIKSDWYKIIYDQLAALEIEQWFQADPFVVRGLDYYTGIIFEAWGTGSLRRALFGGGRYDNLTQQVGGKRKISGVGFAAGDVAMLEYLADCQKQPLINSNNAQLMVALFDEQSAGKSLRLAEKLRQHGIAAMLYSGENKKLDKQYKQADREAIRYVVLQGEEEEANNLFAVKELQTREQKLLSFEQLVSLFS